MPTGWCRRWTASKSRCSPTLDSGALRLQRFLKADRVFEGALVDFERDAPTDDVPLVFILHGQHDEYFGNARSILTAIARGNRRGAELIEARDLRPSLEVMRRHLDTISEESFALSQRETEADLRSNVALEWLIAVVTLVGIILMTGIAVLLRRSQLAAVRATDAQLAALASAALTDNLTHLGNHRAFSDDFVREIARAKRNDDPLTLALIDVDDFKAINDTRGHAYGDDVLALVGEHLRTLRQEDRAYRVGGDEFALLLVETNPEAARTVLARLKQAAQETLSGATLSIGYVNLTSEQLEGEPYELAATALHEAKRRGRNNIVCFDEITEAVNVFSPRKAELVRKLISEEQLSIAFQPIWDVASTFPLAFEALARPDPELGLSGPQEAFDIAERIRQVYELDSVCIAKALAAASNLPAGSTIFVNVSPASLAHPEFDSNAFVASIQAAGLRPDRVVIELTERRIENTAIIIQRAKTLRSLGVRMALDDTGSGHAGLEILSKLNVDSRQDRPLAAGAGRRRPDGARRSGRHHRDRPRNRKLPHRGGHRERRAARLCVRCTGRARPAFSGIRGVQGYLLGRPEVGGVNLRALERHHEYLQRRRRRSDAAARGPKAA